MDGATRQILDTLQPYRNTKLGANRYNTPWRVNADGPADGGTLAVETDPAYGLGLKWFDHKDGTAGNGWTLAKLLNIQIGGKPAAKESPYQSLTDYAHTHGVDLSVFQDAGWVKSKHNGFLCFKFPTATGYRYRYADPAAAGAKYKSEVGYTPCWYGLERAVKLAGDGPLIICNGEPSTIAAQYHNVPACCVTGGEKSGFSVEIMAQLQSVWIGPVLIAYDCDTTGRRASKALAGKLRSAGIHAQAIDLRGTDGYDVADFCRLHNGSSASAILSLPTLMETEYTTGDIVTQTEAPFAKTTQGVTQITAPDWQHHGITLAELQHKEFQPERWIVESILPEGACLLAAKYKSKKSWLALGLGLAVAMNGRALGRLAVSQGRVLYLDLEGKQQRIQKRTRAMLGIKQVDWPDNFHVFTRWPQGDEGLKETEQWFSSYPDTALVVADVLADYRRPIEKHEQPYQYDRTTVQPFNELCERYHAAGILVHHLNKAKNDDIMDGISGTTGLPSAVNSMWGLSKDVNDSNITILHLRGRDYENEEPLALRWDHYMTMHIIEGSAHEVATSAERKSVYQFLEDDQPRTPKEIAEACNKPVESVKQLLRKMLNDGQIDKMGYGKYALLRGRRKFDE